jgi:hypothetical protein
VGGVKKERKKEKGKKLPVVGFRVKHRKLERVDKERKNRKQLIFFVQFFFFRIKRF